MAAAKDTYRGQKERRRSRQSGVTLLEMMLATSIFTVAALAVHRQIADSANLSARVAINADREALQRLVLETASCSDAYLRSTCTASAINTRAPVTVRRVDDVGGRSHVLISRLNAGTAYGSLRLKAECAGTVANPTIRVRAARLKASCTLRATNDDCYNPDPVNKKIITFADDESLLFEDSDICSFGGVEKTVAVRHQWDSSGTGPQGGLTSLPGTPAGNEVIIVSGTSDAIEIAEDETYRGVAGLDGLFCDDAAGWYVDGCYLAATNVSNPYVANENDLYPIDNGCATNTFDMIDQVHLTITCVRR